MLISSNILVDSRPFRVVIILTRSAFSMDRYLELFLLQGCWTLKLLTFVLMQNQKCPHIVVSLTHLNYNKTK